MQKQDSRFLFNADTNGVSPASGGQLDGTQTAWAASTNTAAFFLGQAVGFGMGLVWPSTGSPVGTLKVQYSVDNANNDSFRADEKVVNWFDADLPAVAVNGAGSQMFDVPQTMARWVRVAWTKTSGSLTLTAPVQYKGIS